MASQIQIKNTKTLQIFLNSPAALLEPFLRSAILGYYLTQSRFGRVRLCHLGRISPVGRSES